MTELEKVVKTVVDVWQSNKEMISQSSMYRKNMTGSGLTYFMEHAMPAVVKDLANSGCASSEIFAHPGGSQMYSIVAMNNAWNEISKNTNPKCFIKDGIGVLLTQVLWFNHFPEPFEMSCAINLNELL